MADREAWGLRLFLTGMALGLVLMVFVVASDSSAFYQSLVAPTATGTMRPLGFVLEGGILLAFAMTVAGIGCFPEAHPEEAKPQPRPTAHPPKAQRRKDRRFAKVRAPTAPHGST